MPAPALTLSPGMSPNVTPPPRVSPSTLGLQDHLVARLARISVTQRGRRASGGFFASRMHGLTWWGLQTEQQPPHQSPTLLTPGVSGGRSLSGSEYEQATHDTASGLRPSWRCAAYRQLWAAVLRLRAMNTAPVPTNHDRETDTRDDGSAARRAGPDCAGLDREGDRRAGLTLGRAASAE